MLIMIGTALALIQLIGGLLYGYVASFIVGVAFALGVAFGLLITVREDLRRIGSLTGCPRGGEAQ